MPRTALPAAVAVALLASSAFALPGDLLNLGTAGFQFSGAADVDDAGRVLAFAARFEADGGYVQRAFVHPGTPGGAATVLPTLGGASSFPGALAPGGGAVGSAQTGDGATRAILWTPAGASGFYDALDVGSGAGDGYAYGAGANLIVGERFAPAADAFRAFVYDRATLATRPVAPLFGGVSNALYAVNDGGAAVGVSDDGSAQRAVKLDAGATALRDLGTLGGPGAVANKLNASGAAVGRADLAGDGAPFHAFRHDGTVGGAMVDLGTLGGPFSTALDVNDVGVVVGNADRADGSIVAALWRADGSIVDLDAWLDLVNPAVGAEWTLLDATGVNAAGQVVGRGAFTGDSSAGDFTERAFVLDAGALVVPEPAGVGALAGAVVALARRRRRCLRRLVTT